MGLKSTVDSVWSLTEKCAYRAARAAGVGGDWSPAANFNIFTIAGGPVRILNLFGHVIALFAGANATPLVSFTPVGGVPNPLAVIAVAAAFPLDSLLVWDGSLTAVSGVLRASANLGHNQASDSVGTPATAQTWSSPMECIPGTILIVNAGAADADGQVDWYVVYKPLTPSAVIIPIP